MTFTAPVFWHHQGPRAHQLPDARSDAKGNTVLRRIRAGYMTITPPRTPSPEPAAAELLPLQRQAPPPSTRQQPEPPLIVVDDNEQQQQRPPTPPDYESLEPPAYAQPPAGPPPPAVELPGYSPLPEAIAEPARDLQQGAQQQRTRYRDVLRRRLTATRRFLRSDDDDISSSGDPDNCEDDSESARGVVMYRGYDNQWVGMTDVVRKGRGEVMPRQRGFKAWLRRAWNRILDFNAEHPWLFLLAIFVIIVVVFAVLI